jgi:Raf kinase inhibitor-like YbhB/YbcL family protein
MTFRVHSPAFTGNRPIPKLFSRDGGNVSPAIEWDDAPAGTRSYALIVEDPDAPKGMFRHWAAYDIPAEANGLPEGAGADARNIRMGVNDFGNTQYDGPQPPPGHGTHHYHFRLFALDVPKLDMPQKSSVQDVLTAARQHALGETEVVGTFER